MKTRAKNLQPGLSLVFRSFRQPSFIVPPPEVRRAMRLSRLLRFVTRTDFGSFLSSNVEDFFLIPESEYTPPVLPVELPTFPDPKTEKFGHDFRKAHFFLEPVTYLNHGAFGSTLKEAMEVVHKWQVHCDKQPLRFFDREMMPILVYVVRRMASFIGAPPSNVVLLPNVTDGLNCVLRSLSRHFDSDDSICYFNTTYGLSVGALH